jgi:hypothetical protein
MGTSRGWDGIQLSPNIRGFLRAKTLPVSATSGQQPSAPYITLSVVDGRLRGLPDDLQGTGGGPGGRIIDSTGNNDLIDAIGGPGANGGAGLAIICRGMSFGVSALINLSGADPPTPTVVHEQTSLDVYPGSGGVGFPGALYILLDGNYLSVPVITGKFIGATGTLTQPGEPFGTRDLVPRIAQNEAGWSGYDDPCLISSLF